MRRILESLGVENDVIRNFEAQEISPTVVQTLTDTQLEELGIKTLGKRQLLRGRCQNTDTTSTGEVVLVEVIYSTRTIVRLFICQLSSPWHNVRIWRNQFMG